MHLGRAQVQDEQVELGVGHQGGVGFAAAGDVVHRRASAAQGAQQAIGQNLVIFCNQYPHGGLLGRGAALGHRPVAVILGAIPGIGLQTQASTGATGAHGGPEPPAGLGDGALVGAQPGQAGLGEADAARRAS